MSVAIAHPATLAIIGIIIAAGLSGGFAAHLAEASLPTSSDMPSARSPGLARFLVMGAVASACAPLFLSLVRSQLFAEMQRGEVESFFVFAGICLVAAFSARQFLDTVTRQILRKVEEARETAAEALDKGEDALEIAENPSAEERVEETSRQAPAAAGDATPLKATEQRILNAATKLTHRTATGLAKDSGVPRHLISEQLEHLMDRGLLARGAGPKSGQLRWRITPLGIASLNQSSP